MEEERELSEARGSTDESGSRRSPIEEGRFHGFAGGMLK
jgi:hypothetical protein